MPVLKIKRNGVWQDVSGISEHTHQMKDITDFSENGSGILVQAEEPADAENGTVWIDMDEDGDGSGSAQIPTDYVSFKEQALTDGNKAQARNNIDAASKEEVLLKTGGDMTGWINFGQETQGIYWTTDNNTKFSIRPYAPGNLFQITRTEPNGNEYGALNIHYNGMVDIQGINNNAERLHNIIVVDAGTDINTLSISPGTIVMVRK